MTVPAPRAEEARARMLALFPDGFEETASGAGLELAVYTDRPGDEARLRRAFGAVRRTRLAPGWEEAWKRFHAPAVVGPLWVGPPWETPESELIPVVIDPGRAFGTGAHQTTRLCLELLLDLEPGSLLDVGCGSGVLSIAAAKLGYGPVTAVDVDAAAVDATARNAAANGVAVAVGRADALVDPLPRVHVVAANIALDAVAAVLPRLDCRLAVTSGYFAADRLEPRSYRHLERRSRGRWAADLFERE